MIEIGVTTGGFELALTELRRIEDAFSTRSVMSKMANVLEFAHKHAFDVGYRDPELPWEPTDEFWMNHLANKGSKTLVWTGRAQDSVRARVRGEEVQVMAESYIGKFQFDAGGAELSDMGQVVVETFPVLAGDPWQKLPAGSSGDYKMTKTIHLRKRHIFDVLESDVEQMMYELGQKAGIV